MILRVERGSSKPSSLIQANDTKEGRLRAGGGTILSIMEFCIPAERRKHVLS